ncbi:hypothetical protein D3C87_1938450 [compost metagenome]
MFGPGVEQRHRVFLRLLKQQTQEFAGNRSVAVVVSDQATGQRQGVADGCAMIDLNRDVERLPRGAPGFFRVPL